MKKTKILEWNKFINTLININNLFYMLHVTCYMFLNTNDNWIQFTKFALNFI